MKTKTTIIDDPDEAKYEREASKRDPATQTDILNEIEIHLRYGLPRLKLIGWIIIVLLVLILFGLK
jgi:hypothetical protein